MLKVAVPITLGEFHGDGSPTHAPPVPATWPATGH
jgi:hypothetical protein